MGWKVNGAGGDGGSLTLLSGQSDRQAAMIREIEQENPLFKIIPIYLSRYGLGCGNRTQDKEITTRNWGVILGGCEAFPQNYTPDLFFA